MSTSLNTTDTAARRATFSSRTAFLAAAIGSAVGLGNIWRFPYVAYESGGGAFIIPYLVALLTAGIPLLLLDYALGHRFRSSAPKAFRRLKRWAEPVGWIQVGVAFFITVYYAVIIGWSGLYALKSFSMSWGDDPDTYFFGDFLQMDAEVNFSLDFVPNITIALLIVWALVIGILALGVDKGIGRLSKLFIPLLAVLFVIVVIFSLTLDGAATGLDALFTPTWSALTDPTVWIAAYGQIFFSLSIAFGIMVTYASYLRPRTNLTGSGLVAAFANSSFEVLAGIGVFATLGFMASQQAVPVDEVATSGIGLAFIAFPAVISEMGGAFGATFGFLFFLSLAIAGVTSLMSLVEVVIGAVQDKLHLGRLTATLSVGIGMAAFSLLLFPTSSGLVALDIMDKWTNSLGIVGIAIIALIVIGWILRRGNELSGHLNAVSSFRVGPVWRLLTFTITPIVLAIMLVMEVMTLIKEPYGGYTQTQIALYGWVVLALILLVAALLSLAPWRGSQYLDGHPGSDFNVPPSGSTNLSPAYSEPTPASDAPTKE